VPEARQRNTQKKGDESSRHRAHIAYTYTAIRTHIFCGIVDGLLAAIELETAISVLATR